MTTNHLGVSCAVDYKLKHYGYWRNRGIHVWTNQSNAEKCCTKEFTRCLSVTTYDVFGTILTHYWLRKSND